MTTLDEMWQRLIRHQPYADKYGYGPEWMIMCKVRNHGAAWAARRAVLNTQWVSAGARAATALAVSSAVDGIYSVSSVVDGIYCIGDRWLRACIDFSVQHIRVAEHHYDHT